MKYPLISVIVPYYNSSIFLLRKCLNSILRQDYPSIEVLVMVDGSNQPYLKLKEEFLESDQRIKFFISEKNIGVSSQRNKGIEYAKGEYIVFVDSDDYIEDNMLTRLFDCIKGCEIAFCGVDNQYYPCDEGKYDARYFFSTPSRFNYIQYTNFSVNKLYRKSIIVDNNLKFDVDVKLGEDALFLSQYLSKCKHLGFTRYLLYHYIYNGSSSSQTFNIRYAEWEIKVMQAIWDEFNQYSLCDREQYFMYDWLIMKYSIIIDRYSCERLKKRISKDDFVQMLSPVIKSDLFNKLLKAHLSKSPYMNKAKKRKVEVFKHGLEASYYYYVLYSYMVHR